MRSGSFLRELKELNQYLYTNPHKNFKNWELLDSYSDTSGVFIEIFDIGNNEVLMAVRGTDVNLTQVSVKDAINDIENDINIYLNKLPKQYKIVETFYNNNKNKYFKFILTGYSLGGSLVQMLGGEFNIETYTFEALGTKQIKQSNGNSVTNFINVLDAFVHPTIKNQVGEIYVMKVTSKKEFYPYKPINPYYHWYPQYGEPTEIEKYNPSKEQSKSIKNYLKDGIINKSSMYATELHNKAKKITKSTYNKVLENQEN